MILTLQHGLWLPQRPRTGASPLASRFGPWWRKRWRSLTELFQDFPVYDPTTGMPLYSGTQGGVPMYGCAVSPACGNCGTGTAASSLTVAISGVTFNTGCITYTVLSTTGSHQYSGDPNVTVANLAFQTGGTSLCDGSVNPTPCKYESAGTSGGPYYYSYDTYGSGSCPGSATSRLGFRGIDVSVLNHGNGTVSFTAYIILDAVGLPSGSIVSGCHQFGTTLLTGDCDLYPVVISNSDSSSSTWWGGTGVPGDFTGGTITLST